MSVEVVKRQQGLEIRLWFLFCHLVAVWLGPCFGQVMYISEPVFLRCKIEMGFSRWLIIGKGSAFTNRRHRFDPWIWKIPWRRKWQPTPGFLPGNPMDRGAWWATVHGVARELDTT